MNTSSGVAALVVLAVCWVCVRGACACVCLWVVFVFVCVCACVCARVSVCPCVCVFGGALWGAGPVGLSRGFVWVSLHPPCHIESVSVFCLFFGSPTGAPTVLIDSWGSSLHWA